MLFIHRYRIRGDDEEWDEVLKKAGNTSVVSIKRWEGILARVTMKRSCKSSPFYEIHPHSSVKPFFFSNIWGVRFLFAVLICIISRLMETHLVFSSMRKRVCKSVLLPAATRRGSWMEETLQRAMVLLHTGNSRRKKRATSKRKGRADSKTLNDAALVGQCMCLCTKAATVSVYCKTSDVRVPASCH